MKITNHVRRIVAFAGLGWALADLLPPCKPHFTVVDGVIGVLALAILIMSYFIKEPKP